MSEDVEDEESGEDVEEEDGESSIHTEGLSKIYALLHYSPIRESPIDIHLPNTTKIQLTELNWYGMNVSPKKVKLTNNGFTINYSAVWSEARPLISGGPLIGDYSFSQLHFHWDSHNQAGSEHTISGEPQILEMHAVFYKSCYRSQESALLRKDGIAIVAYLFRLQDENNEEIGNFIERIPDIREAHATIRLEPAPLETFLPSFINDYFFYIGSVNTSTSIHYAHWLICRVPLGIALNQVEVFRSLIAEDGQPLLRNCRDVQPSGGCTVFHVNPSGMNAATLLIMQKSTDKRQERAMNSKYTRSSCEYPG